ncbi:unnamed protein product [Arabidopsis lyrata]|nr:unnamed protein product [Arabidopsis lyrata]
MSSARKSRRFRHFSAVQRSPHLSSSHHSPLLSRLLR